MESDSCWAPAKTMLYKYSVLVWTRSRISGQNLPTEADSKFWDPHISISDKWPVTTITTVIYANWSVFQEAFPEGSRERERGRGCFSNKWTKHVKESVQKCLWTAGVSRLQAGCLSCTAANQQCQSTERIFTSLSSTDRKYQLAFGIQIFSILDRMMHRISLNSAIWIRMLLVFIQSMRINRQLYCCTYVVWCGKVKEQHVLVCCVSFERQSHNVGHAQFVWNGVLANTAALVMQWNLYLQHSRTSTRLLTVLPLLLLLLLPTIIISIASCGH